MVRAFAASASANVSTGPHGDYLLLRARVGDLETGLGVRFCEHTHPRSRHTLVRACERGSGEAVGLLPAVVRRHALALFGVHELLPVQRGGGARTVGDFPGKDITPAVIARKYVLTERGGRSSAMSQGVAAFEDAQFRPDYVTHFQRDFNLSLVNVSVKGPNSGGYFGEARRQP